MSSYPGGLESRQLWSLLPCSPRTNGLKIGANVWEIAEAEARLVQDVKGWPVGAIGQKKVGAEHPFARGEVAIHDGAIARADAEAMCDRVWQALSKHYGVRRESPATWKEQYLVGTHHLPKSENFDEFGSPAIRAALDDPFGSGNWQPPERWGSLLVTSPNTRDRWTVPHQAWHLDYPASRSMKGLFIVRIFVCLAKLEPGSGGTVLVAGSHRLVQNLVSKDGVARMRSADARTALIHTCPWMRSLCTLDESVDRVEAFMRTSTVVDGIEVRVVEMTGEPGDVLPDPSHATPGQLCQECNQTLCPP
jgi:hypothetical protein